MPKISVIVPVYNVEPYIHRCVDSILAQTFTDFELILIDDGSPDNCPAICDEYAVKDDRVHVIHQENGGLSAARNAGIDWVFENSDSEWISFVDSDDWVAENYLEVLYKGASDNNLSVSVCGFIRTKGEIDLEDNETMFQLITPEEFYVKDRTNFVIAWGKLYKIECFNEIRFPVGKIHEDEFVTYKILFKYQQIAAVDAQLYYYYTNPSGIMLRDWSEERLAAYDAMMEQLSFLDNNGFQNAYKRTLIAIVSNLATNYQQCNNDRYKNIIIAKIRRTIKDHRNHFQLFVDNVPWICEIAYPKRMKIYWLVHSQVNKLKRKK